MQGLWYSCLAALHAIMAKNASLLVNKTNWISNSKSNCLTLRYNYFRKAIIIPILKNGKKTPKILLVAPSKAAQFIIVSVNKKLTYQSWPVVNIL